jgi:hypothetical protein
MIASSAAFSTLRISTEFGDSHDVDAGYLLTNWANHREAMRVIRAAMAGKSGSFETPAGLVIVRPIG